MGTTDCVSNFSCDRNMLSTTASYCCSIDNSFRNYEAGIGIIILTIVPVLGELSSTPPDLPDLAPAGPARPQATSEAGPGAGPRATPAPPPGGRAAAAARSQERGIRGQGGAHHRRGAGGRGPVPLGSRALH